MVDRPNGRRVQRNGRPDTRWSRLRQTCLSKNITKRRVLIALFVAFVVVFLAGLLTGF